MNLFCLVENFTGYVFWRQVTCVLKVQACQVTRTKPNQSEPGQTKLTQPQLVSLYVHVYWCRRILDSLPQGQVSPVHYTVVTVP
jgi:hypothetical protein